MDFIRSQGGLSGIQLPNASSGRQQVRKSVGDHDSQDDELLGSPVQVSLLHNVIFTITRN
ncbi:unnamed protein product [Camellia sinensis]